MRELDGHLRFDTAGELDVLNRIWELDCVFTNYLLAQKKLVFKQRHGATVKKRHDLATTPFKRASATKEISGACRRTMEETMDGTRPGDMHVHLLLTCMCI